MGRVTPLKGSRMFVVNTKEFEQPEAKLAQPDVKRFEKVNEFSSIDLFPTRFYPNGTQGNRIQIGRRNNQRKTGVIKRSYSPNP